jgi:hypothetical protein
LATRIGIIGEGPIDEALLPPLLDRIAQARAGYTWPTNAAEFPDILRIRKRGHGGVLAKVRALAGYLNEYPGTDHAFYVILLDSKTRAAQEEIRKLIQGNPLFVMGIAIQEIEAWWLADKRNLLEFLGIDDTHCQHTRFGQAAYCPEEDDDPKKTLDELTVRAPNLDATYGAGNSALAREFATEYWAGRADLAAIEGSCPKGFAPFCRDVEQSLRREVARRKAESGQAPPIGPPPARSW